MADLLNKLSLTSKCRFIRESHDRLVTVYHRPGMKSHMANLSNGLNSAEWIYRIFDGTFKGFRCV